MRPIPPELLEFYPSQPNSNFPGRPWWSISFGYDTILTRRDGVEVSFFIHSQKPVFTHTVYGQALPSVSPEFAEKVFSLFRNGSRSRFIEMAALIDNWYPIPFPGVRVGQVWAQPIGSTWDVYLTGHAQVATDHASSLFRNHKAVGGTKPLESFGPETVQWVQTLSGGSINKHTGEMNACLSDKALTGMILLGDTCCPWLAPWTPSL